jgi:hypothetical protein
MKKHLFFICFAMVVFASCSTPAVDVVKEVETPVVAEPTPIVTDTTVVEISTAVEDSITK